MQFSPSQQLRRDRFKIVQDTEVPKISNHAVVGEVDRQLVVELTPARLMAVALEAPVRSEFENKSIRFSWVKVQSPLFSQA